MNLTYVELFLKHFHQLDLHWIVKLKLGLIVSLVLSTYFHSFLVMMMLRFSTIEVAARHFQNQNCMDHHQHFHSSNRTFLYYDNLALLTHFYLELSIDGHRSCILLRHRCFQFQCLTSYDWQMSVQ